jgi:hypothetical protein
MKQALQHQQQLQERAELTLLQQRDRVDRIDNDVQEMCEHLRLPEHEDEEGADEEGVDDDCDQEEGAEQLVDQHFQQQQQQQHHAQQAHGVEEDQQRRLEQEIRERVGPAGGEQNLELERELERELAQRYHQHQHQQRQSMQLHVDGSIANVRYQ